MLVRLVVRDLGVLDAVDLDFGPGMTVVTGETGAGKTLLVEALQLACGGRADAGLVRPGATSASVVATFSQQGHLVVLERTVPITGRSRAAVDGQPVSVAELREAATSLLDIHGQHEAQSLFAPDAARRALDRAGPCDSSTVQRLRGELERLDRQVAQLGGDAAEVARARARLTEELAVLDAASLEEPSELESLAAEVEWLSDLEGARTTLSSALSLLDGDEVGAVTAVAAAARLLDARPATATLGARLEALLPELEDLSSELRARLELAEANPERFEAVLARQRLLRDLVRRYGSTLEDVLEARTRRREELEDLEASGANREELLVRRAGLIGDLEGASEALRSARLAAAPRLAAAVEARLHELGMLHARFSVDVGDDPAGDEVGFRFSANPGMRPQELARVASGGELARVMLALRLAVPGGPEAMVFDEVDAGVGGAAAVHLGRLLARLAQDRQVLVVTHLAQVAAQATAHLVVTKRSEAAATTTEVRLLASGDRSVELARMLSGSPESSTALAHAAELLSQRLER